MADEDQDCTECRRQPEWLTGTGILVIDGCQGVGKSTLAAVISKIADIPCIHLDEFLVRNQGSFVDSLRLPDIRSALRQRPIIVEGVCVLEVMHRLGIQPGRIVYVRAVESIPHGAPSRGRLDSEVFAYHRKWRPLALADVVYAVSRKLTDENPAATSNTRADVDIAFINAKTKLAITLAVGGMIALVIGLAVLMYGITGQDEAIIKVSGVDISARGIGGVIMATSAVWAYFSYKCRPIYSHTRQSFERFDPDGKAFERHEFVTGTAANVEGIPRFDNPSH